MTPDTQPIGSIVRSDCYGRGIIIDTEIMRWSGQVLFHVRWDKSIVWASFPNYKAEIYHCCWVDDIDVEIVSEVK